MIAREFVLLMTCPTSSFGMAKSILLTVLIYGESGKKSLSNNFPNIKQDFRDK